MCHVDRTNEMPGSFMGCQLKNQEPYKILVEQLKYLAFLWVANFSERDESSDVSCRLGQHLVVPVWRPLVVDVLETGKVVPWSQRQGQLGNGF